MIKKMKIVEISRELYPTNRISNNAIYSHVATLADGLSEVGNDVDLFCTDESVSKATIHPSFSPISKMDATEKTKRYHTFKHISNAFEFAKKESADIIHSHFTLLANFFYRLVDIPTVVSIHSPISDEIKPFLEDSKDCKFISFSLAQRKQMPQLNWVANIYHGVDTSLFSFEPEGGDYMLYLGRITEEKGVHFAIETAKATGIPLRIAGPSYSTEGYWHKMIEPHIDGKLIRYFGHADFSEKIKLLQGAKVVLFPTLYDEAFGYVMIESMSCGTPVIGFGNGSVPEIIKDGKTGFVVNDVLEMTEAVKKIDSIDRKVVRKRAEDFFSIRKMITGYSNVFKRIVEEEKYKKTKNGKN